MTEDLKERIERDAEAYVKLMNWGYHKEAKEDFIAGATKYAASSLEKTQIDYYENKIESVIRNEMEITTERNELLSENAALKEEIIKLRNFNNTKNISHEGGGNW